MIRVCAATRFSEPDFREKSWLWKSLKDRSQIVLQVAYSNARGLPEVYNEALDGAGTDDVLVFVHDDLFISDLHFAERLERALGSFDVVGLAGNTRRVPNQARWVSADGEKRDDEHLSGKIAHPRVGADLIDIVDYGPAPQEAKLLDGVFLAVHVEALRLTDVRFDPRFKFHFYDLDFCRSCEKAGLKMGTWPIAAVHHSPGRYGTALWQAAKLAYFGKWGE